MNLSTKHTNGRVKIYVYESRMCVRARARMIYSLYGTLIAACIFLLQGVWLSARPISGACAAPQFQPGQESTLFFFQAETQPRPFVLQELLQTPFFQQSQVYVNTHSSVHIHIPDQSCNLLSSCFSADQNTKHKHVNLTLIFQLMESFWLCWRESFIGYSVSQ